MLFKFNLHKSLELKRKDFIIKCGLQNSLKPRFWREKKLKKIFSYKNK